MIFVLRTVCLRRYLRGFASLLLMPCSYASPVVEALDARSTSYPAPISVTPSQDWDGNDGPWSSFIIQIGTPAQSVKVLISTAATQTWAVATEGCGSGDLTDCAKLRGGEYNYTASSSWVPNIANLSTDIYQLGLEGSLGYTGNGRYGFDDITLGIPWSGEPILKNQTVAGIATKSFFMGLFGLTPRPSNFTSFNNPILSYIENLYSQSIIPSKSWGYTAGNQYRLNGVLGSLTIGGYDTARFAPSNLTFNFNTVDDRDLSVEVESITTSAGVSLLPSPIFAFLDSTLPYIYLPVAACILFENTFGIIWNETSQLYLINATQHVLLQAQNPSITFTLGSILSSETVNITFPYAAFDLTASWPLTESSTCYFPLRRADNDTQYTLGRAFFQEAYVIADYHRNNFSVLQCKWDSAPESLVAIIPPPKSTTSTSSLSHPLSTGAISGIAAGSGVLLITLALLFFFFYLPKHRKRKAAEVANNEVRPAKSGLQEYYQKPELDRGEMGRKPDAYGPVFETDGSKVTPPAELGAQPRTTEIFEMPALEEVASEASGQSRREELSAGQDGKRSKSWDRGKREVLCVRPRGPERGTYEQFSTEMQSQMLGGRGPRTESTIPGARTPYEDTFTGEIRSSGSDSVSSVSQTVVGLGPDLVSPQSPSEAMREQMSRLSR